MYSIWYVDKEGHADMQGDAYTDIAEARAEIARLQQMDCLSHWLRQYLSRIEIREITIGHTVETIDVHAE